MMYVSATPYFAAMLAAITISVVSCLLALRAYLKRTIHEAVTLHILSVAFMAVGLGLAWIVDYDQREVALLITGIAVLGTFAIYIPLEGLRARERSNDQ